MDSMPTSVAAGGRGCKPARSALTVARWGRGQGGFGGVVPGDGEEVLNLAFGPSLESGPEALAEEDLDAGRGRDGEQDAVEAGEDAAGEDREEDRGRVHVGGLALDHGGEDV